MHCHYCSKYIDVNNIVYGPSGYGVVYISHFCCIVCRDKGVDYHMVRYSDRFKLQEQEKD